VNIAKFRQFATCALSLSMLSSCHFFWDDSASKQNVAMAPIEESEELEELLALPISPWDGVITQIKELPDAIREKLSDDYILQLENYLSQQALGYTPEELGVDLSLKDTQLPLIPGFTTPLKFKSPYDKYAHHYLLKAPIHPETSKSVLILLGDLSITTKERIDPSLNDWVVYIPSRANMNYQLTAEGDFWALLKELETLYPQIGQNKKFIIGIDTAADAALLFANNYPAEFSGVAYSGGKICLNLANLDSRPVVNFTSVTAHSRSSLWGEKKLINRLQARGNDKSLAIDGKITEAIKNLHELANLPKPLLPSLTFEDYHHAQLAPWLKVMSKFSEEEPASIEGEVSGDELVLKSHNVAAVTLSRENSLGFPKGICKVRFNEKLYVFQKSKSKITLGEDVSDGSWKHKGNLPSGFMNFFRREPVYILYEDTRVSDSYKKQAQSFAEALSQVNFVGFRNFNVRLPVLPLSEYDAEELPAHRVIVIGQQATLRSLMNENPSYYPITVLPNEILVNYESLKTPYKEVDTVAYGLIYPPEKKGKQKLCLHLAANDLKGLQTLQDNYLSGTSLYRQEDLRLWVKKKNKYDYAGDMTFDTYWSNSNLEKANLTMPQLANETWEIFLQDLLTISSGVANLATGPLSMQDVKPPRELTPSHLHSYIPDHKFAVVKASSRTSSATINRLKGNAAIPQGRTQFLVTEEQLQNLSEQELSSIQFDWLPYSLHEMIFKKLRANPREFGRELLRINNLIADQ
jgi:hypothetical protein